MENLLSQLLQPTSLVMASIDPQDTVCALLDVPCPTSHPRSPVPSTAPAPAPAPVPPNFRHPPALDHHHHHQHHHHHHGRPVYQGDGHRDLLLFSSHGSFLTNPSPLHPVVGAVFYPSTVSSPNSLYSLLQENDQGHSVIAAQVGKRRHLNLEPVHFLTQSHAAHVMYRRQNSFNRRSSLSRTDIFSEPALRRMIGLGSPEDTTVPVDPVHQSSPQPRGIGQHLTAPEAAATDFDPDNRGVIGTGATAPTCVEFKKTGRRVHLLLSFEHHRYHRALGDPHETSVPRAPHFVLHLRPNSPHGTHSSRSRL